MSFGCDVIMHVQQLHIVTMCMACALEALHYAAAAYCSLWQWVGVVGTKHVLAHTHHCKGCTVHRPACGAAIAVLVYAGIILLCSGHAPWVIIFTCLCCVRSILLLLWPRRLSGGGDRRKSLGGTPPSAGVPPSLLKPTAASAARAQATTKPKGDDAVWKR